MAKDPAFLFYPGDWIMGTMHLTLLEKGAYMELLILQFTRGKFTEDNARHVLRDQFADTWPVLKEKFETDGTSYWNERLALEKEKRKNHSEKQRENSIKRWEKHTKRASHGISHGISDGMQLAYPMGMPLENENANVFRVLDNSESLSTVGVPELESPSKQEAHAGKQTASPLAGSNLFRKPNIPTYQQIFEATVRAGGNAEMAQAFYEKHEATGWYLSGSPIVNYATLVNKWVTSWKARESTGGSFEEKKRLENEKKWEAVKKRSG